MLSTGAAPPAVQLAITLVLCLVPTVAFFGLVRGLERLRDDELIEQWAAKEDEQPEPAGLNAFLAGRPNAESTGEASEGSATDRSANAAGRSDETPANAAGRSDETSSNDESGGATVGSNADSDVRCRHCGTPNPEGVRYCSECIGRL